MELHLHSLFGLHEHSCSHCLRGWDPATPPPPVPLHLGSYTRALLVSLDRRHLFVTPWLYLSSGSMGEGGGGMAGSHMTLVKVKCSLTGLHRPPLKSAWFPITFIWGHYWLWDAAIKYWLKPLQEVQPGFGLYKAIFILDRNNFAWI
jgi:hypothetical protein